jgi:hypothetical protein
VEMRGLRFVKELRVEEGYQARPRGSERGGGSYKSLQAVYASFVLDTGAASFFFFCSDFQVFIVTSTAFLPTEAGNRGVLALALGKLVARCCHSHWYCHYFLLFLLLPRCSHCFPAFAKRGCQQIELFFPVFAPIFALTRARGTGVIESCRFWRGVQDSERLGWKPGNWGNWVGRVKLAAGGWICTQKVRSIAFVRSIALCAT